MLAKTTPRSLSLSLSLSVFMSCLSFETKVQPAKRALQGFTSTIQRKLHKLKRFKAIKKTTKRLNTTLAAVLTHSISLPPRLRPLPRKRRALTRRPSTLCPPNHQHGYRHRLRHGGFAPVYVDELFMPQPVPVQVKQREPSATTSNDVQKHVANAVFTEPGSSRTALSDEEALAGISKVGEKDTVISGGRDGVDEWESSEMVLSLSPQLQGVDKRAEEFITMFKAEMRLQRQRSFGEYEEMLARGV